jgi:hypothetical protein
MTARLEILIEEGAAEPMAGIGEERVGGPPEARRSRVNRLDAFLGREIEGFTSTPARRKRSAALCIAGSFAAITRS